MSDPATNGCACLAKALMDMLASMGFIPVRRAAPAGPAPDPEGNHLNEDGTTYDPEQDEPEERWEPRDETRARLVTVTVTVRLDGLVIEVEFEE